MTSSWRLSPTGAALLLVVAAIGITAIAIGVGVPLAAGLAVAAGVGIAGTITLAHRGSPFAVAGSGALALASGILLLGAAGVAVSAGSGPGSRLLVVVAITVASLGTIGTITGAIGQGTVQQTLPVCMVAGVPLAAFVLVAGPSKLPIIGGQHPFVEVRDGIRDAIVAVLAPAPDLLAVASFVGLLAMTLGSVVVLLPAVTLVDLLHRRHRAPVEAARDRVVEWCATILFYCFVGGLALGFGASLLMIAVQGQLLPIDGLDLLVQDASSLAIAIATIEPLRWVLLAVFGIVLTLRILSALPSIRRIRYSTTARWLPAVSGGIVLLGVLILFYGTLWRTTIEPLLTARPPDTVLVVLPQLGIWLTAEDVLRLLAPPTGQWIAVGVVLGTLLLVWLILGMLVFAGGLGLLRDQNGSGGVAASGLVAGAVGAALASASIVALAIPVAAGVLVADLGRYAADLRTELGAEVSGRTPLIVHALGGLVVGTFAVLGVVVSGTVLIDRIEPAWELPVLVGLAIGLLFVAMAITVRTRRVTHTV